MSIAARQFIEFFEMAKEVRSGENTGAPKYEDVDFIRIHNPGGKDVVEREVKDYIDNLNHQAQSGSPEASRLRDQVTKSYADWKAKKDPEIEGTLLKFTPLLSAAETKAMADLKIFTVEQLAEVDENGLKAIGMGSRNLKRKAVDYLKSMDGPGKVTQEMNDLKEANAALQEQLKELQDVVGIMKAQQKSKKEAA